MAATNLSVWSFDSNKFLDGAQFSRSIAPIMNAQGITTIMDVAIDLQSQFSSKKDANNLKRSLNFLEEHVNSLPLFLRPELYSENKKAKFSNSITYDESVLLTKDGFTASASLDDAVGLVGKYLDFRGYTPANKKSIMHNFPNYSCSELEYDNSLFVRIHDQSMEELPDNSTKKFANGCMYNQSFKGRDDSCSIVSSENQYVVATHKHSIGFLRDKDTDADPRDPGKKIKNIKALVLDFCINFKSKPSEKVKVIDAAPSLPRKVTKKLKPIDVLPRFVKVHVQSKCSCINGSKYETEDTATWITFSVFVGVTDSKSSVCKFDTFRAIVLSEVLKMNQARILTGGKH